MVLYNLFQDIQNMKEEVFELNVTLDSNGYNIAYASKVHSVSFADSSIIRLLHYLVGMQTRHFQKPVSTIGKKLWEKIVDFIHMNKVNSL